MVDNVQLIHHIKISTRAQYFTGQVATGQLYQLKTFYKSNLNLNGKNFHICICEFIRMQKWPNDVNLVNQVDTIDFLPEIPKRKFQNIFLTKWSNPSEAPAQSDRFQVFLPNKSQVQPDQHWIKTVKAHSHRPSHSTVIYRTPTVVALTQTYTNTKRSNIHAATFVLNIYKYICLCARVCLFTCTCITPKHNLSRVMLFPPSLSTRPTHTHQRHYYNSSLGTLLVALNQQQNLGQRKLVYMTYTWNVWIWQG